MKITLIGIVKSLITYINSLSHDFVKAVTAGRNASVLFAFLPPAERKRGSADL